MKSLRNSNLIADKGGRGKRNQMETRDRMKGGRETI